MSYGPVVGSKSGDRVICAPQLFRARNRSRDLDQANFCFALINRSLKKLFISVVIYMCGRIGQFVVAGSSPWLFRRRMRSSLVRGRVNSGNWAKDLQGPQSLKLACYQMHPINMSVYTVYKPSINFQLQFRKGGVNKKRLAILQRTAVTQAYMSFLYY